MNREGCVSAASCGACKLGFAARSPNLGEDDACAFAYPQPLRATAALITPTPTTAGEVELAVTFGARFTLSFYRLVSGNSHPSQDPTSWVLEGRTSGVSAWEPLDAQRGVLFGARHQTMTFPIKSAVWPAPTYTQYRFRFRTVQNAPFQLGAATAITGEAERESTDAAAGTTRRTTNRAAIACDADDAAVAGARRRAVALPQPGRRGRDDGKLRTSKVARRERSGAVHNHSLANGGQGEGAEALLQLASVLRVPHKLLRIERVGSAELAAVRSLEVQE